MADINVDRKYAGMRRSHGNHHAAANGYVSHWFFLRERRFLVTKLAPGFTLDIACGSGLMLNRLTQLPDVIGIDFNAAACKQAKWNQFQIVRGDAFELPFANESFDNIVNCQFFNQQPLTQRQPFFSEVSRVLRPGGECHLLWRNGSSVIHRFANSLLSAVDRLRGKEIFPQYIHTPNEMIDAAVLFDLQPAGRGSSTAFGPPELSMDNPLASIIGASHYLCLRKRSP